MKTSKGKLYPLLVALLVFLLDVPIGSAYISDAQDAPLEEVIGKIPHLSRHWFAVSMRATRTGAWNTPLSTQPLRLWSSDGGRISGLTPTQMDLTTDCR